MPRRSTQKWVTKMVQELGPSRKRKQILGIGTTYDPRKAIGEVCLLLFSLVGTPWRALLAMITVAFGVLRVRDWQIHPAKATAAEAATDGLAMGACMLLSQIYFHVQSPSFAATNFTEVRHGVGLSMVAITTWRLIFHLATSKNDAQAEPEYRVFSAAVRVIALIWTAVQFTIATSLQAVPDAGHARDLLLGYTTMGSLIVLYRLRKKSGGSFFWDVPREKPLSSDPVVEEFQQKAELLTETLDTRFDDWKVLFFKMTFALCFSSPLTIAAFRWWTGHGSEVQWLQLLADVLVAILLIPLCVMIRHFNLAAAAVLKDAAKARAAKSDGGTIAAPAPVEWTEPESTPTMRATIAERWVSFRRDVRDAVSFLSLLCRAAAAAALFAGFFVIAVGGPAAAIFLLYKVGVLYPEIHLYLILGYMFVVFYTIENIFGWESFRSVTGRLVTEEQHPQLIERIRKIAAVAGEPAPDTVYLTNEAEVSLLYRRKFFGRRGRPFIKVGLPLLHVLSVSEFEAVLAHEFGHFRSYDGSRIGRWGYAARVYMKYRYDEMTFTHDMEWGDALLVLPLLLTWYGRLFDRASRSLAEIQELAADRFAAETAGSDVYAKALRTIQRTRPVCDHPPLQKRLGAIAELAHTKHDEQALAVSLLNDVEREWRNGMQPLNAENLPAYRDGERVIAQ